MFEVMSTQSMAKYKNASKGLCKKLCNIRVATVKVIHSHPWLVAVFLRFSSAGMTVNSLMFAWALAELQTKKRIIIATQVSML